MKLPRKVPFIVLQGTVLFPQALLPLRIFEPRYKEVLEEALETNRMMAVVMPRQNVHKLTHSEQLFSIAGLGLIRAAVKDPKGDTNLILEGLGRVQLETDYPQDQSEPIGDIKKYPNIDVEDEIAIEALNVKVLELCEQFQDSGLDLPETVTAYLSQAANDFNFTIADLISSQPFFVADPFDRQELLEIASLPARLRRLIQHMQKALE